MTAEIVYVGHATVLIELDGVRLLKPETLAMMTQNGQFSTPVSCRAQPMTGRDFPVAGSGVALIWAASSTVFRTASSV